jgi:glyoxylase-like metal-dependent hydrolase (beta-lactamase superfamily II)
VAIVDQPEDWTEPGAWTVTPGVHRVPLPIPATGLHAVNAYVIEDPGGLVVIDSGWAMPETETALAAALRGLGFELADIAHVLVTHAHWDHYSQALALRAAFGSRVRIGRGEKASIEAFNVADGLHPRQVELLRLAGAPEIADRIAAAAVPAAERDIHVRLPDSWLDDGERVALDARGLDVFATPGHTSGHIVLRDAPAGILFAGDHILPHITPSLGLETLPEPKPLRSYLSSLRLVQDMPDTLLLPAHGPVTPSVITRVEELLKHHEVRLEAALTEVRAGHETAFEVAGALRWTRRQKRLEDLELFSQMLAVLEIEAHLDVLADRDLVTRSDQDGVHRYTTTAGQ